MGFFSYSCKGCGQSLRSYHAVTKDSSWMQSVVVYLKDGRFFQGAYDGYGRLDTGTGELELMDCEFTAYHQRCWRLLGRPKGFVGQAGHAQDQGFFTDFHPAKPQTRAELKALQKRPQ